MSVKPTRAQQMANEDSAEVARAWAKRCATLERELATAQATIAKLQWTEIAPENLPLDRDYLLYRKFQGSDVFSVGYFSPKSGWWLIDGEIMRGNSGYTHFCPISPPAQDSATEKP